VGALRRVPIRNDDRELDCQQWVEDALGRFRDGGMLSSEAYDRGLDGMSDAISEATDAEE
jgi:hypothetical protein